MIHNLLEWLGNTGWSIRMLESFWVWPLLESSHTLSIAFFVGLAMMMDVRLMGFSFGGIRMTDFTDRLLPLVRWGFAFTTVTGVLVFYSNPLRYWHNIFFRFKLLMLVVAGLNILYFHMRTHKRVGEWDLEPSPPSAAKLAGLLSFSVWAAIIIAGRLIAYNWFDCDLVDPETWVYWASQCVQMEVQ